MKRVLASILAVLVLNGAMQPVRAAQPTPASGPIWYQNQRVEYDWNNTAVPPGWAKAAMAAAAGDATTSTRAKAASFFQRDGADNWIAYTDDIPTNWAIGYTVANPPSWFHMRLRPQGTPLDWGTLRWCQFYSDPPTGCYDLEMVTLHEFGHVHSLDHIDGTPIDSYTDSVMHESGLHSKAKLGWDMHAYGRCDIARLQIRYDLLSASTQVSTCLDLPTSLSLSVNSTAIVAGTYVGFTARLKIADDAPYSILASDPLAGRNVTLQRRVPGATSWSNVTQLSSASDDPGLYARSIAPAATYEWRALFNAPSNEGLDDDSSSILKITVSGACPTSGTDPDSPTC